MLGKWFNRGAYFVVAGNKADKSDLAVKLWTVNQKNELEIFKIVRKAEGS